MRLFFVDSRLGNYDRLSISHFDSPVGRLVELILIGTVALLTSGLTLGRVDTSEAPERIRKAMGQRVRGVPVRGARPAATAVP